MSNRRDSLWIRTVTGTHQATAIASSAMHTTSIALNGTVIGDGDIPCAGHQRLRGRIETINVHLADTTIAAPSINLIFFSGATCIEDDGAADRTIEYESFVNTDFWTTGGAQRASKSGLSIPYFDEDDSKKFHIGVMNNCATSIDAKILTLGFSWRPDVGEP